MAPPNEMMLRSWKGTARMPVDNWRNSGLTRYEYMFNNLEAAIVIEFDSQDKNHQGDVRYRELASEGTRWRDDLPMAPLHVKDLQRGRQYEFRQLPLGSYYIDRTSQVEPHIGDQRVLHFTYYNYYPRPSKGTNMDTDLGEFALKGRFTDLGKTPVIFVDHPNKKYFELAKKSAASNRPAIKTSSMYKKKKESRMKRAAVAKQTRRRKAAFKARTVSTDKLSPKKSTTRRKSR